jgi:hypothetical protein
MTDDLKDVKRWYREHDMEYIAEDWGARDPETGEGLENADVRGGKWKGGRQASTAFLNFTQWLSWLEDQGVVEPLWRPRSVDDRAYVVALEDFFQPYLGLLPRPKGNLLAEYMGSRRTQADIAEATGRTQQAVSAQLKTALRALIRRIAEDDPAWTPPSDGRVRDYDGELRSAERVFDLWWEARKARQ